MATASRKKTFIDPVCKMTVRENGPVQPYTFGKCTFYFCSEGCRQTFVADPKRNIESGSTTKKGWWGRYLDRLSKATGGQAQKCH